MRRKVWTVAFVVSACLLLCSMVGYTDTLDDARDYDVCKERCIAWATTRSIETGQNYWTLRRKCVNNCACQYGFRPADKCK